MVSILVVVFVMDKRWENRMGLNGSVSMERMVGCSFGVQVELLEKCGGFGTCVKRIGGTKLSFS